MGNRDFRVTFTKDGRIRTLVYPGHTPYDAERDFVCDFPDAELLSILEDSVGVVVNSFAGTAHGVVIQARNINQGGEIE